VTRLPNKVERVFSFRTPNSDRWSGAKELRVPTMLDHLSRGLPVAATITKFSRLHPRMLHGEKAGLDVETTTRCPAQRIGNQVLASGYIFREFLIT
jgi:hypothetical protein